MDQDDDAERHHKHRPLTDPVALGSAWIWYLTAEPETSLNELMTMDYYFALIRNASTLMNARGVSQSRP